MRDSNSQSPASKAGAFAIFANGAAGGWGWIRTNLGLHPHSFTDYRDTPSSPPILELWAGWDSNPQQSDFKSDAFTYYATGPGNYLSRYRKMVWAAGFEPATSRFRAGISDQAELRPEGEGRGRAVTFMGENYILFLKRAQVWATSKCVQIVSSF